jgi:hypothetical protein
MAKGHDATDLLCYRWADTRRQLLGLTNPRLAKDYLGALRSTLGNVQRLGDGASSHTAREQHFPEVYEGDALLVNLAVKQMPAQLRPFMDLHYTLGRGATNRADLLGITRSEYWKRIGGCKRFIEGYLAARADRAA